MKKLVILKKAKSVFKNWTLFPLAYYNITKRNFLVFESKTNKIIKIRKNSTDLMALTHVWLIEEYKQPYFEIRSDDVVIDIGAHVGLFTIYASQFCKTGKILSFEPVKENFQILIENIKENNLKQVKPYNLAVSNSNDYVKLYLNTDESGHSMFSPSSKSIQVKSISLEKIFQENNIEYCNFLKLDCEGAEYEIIKNLPLEYFQKIEKMIIEYHMVDSHPELLEELKTTLSKNNFRFEIKTLFKDIGFLYARKIT